MKFFLAFTVFLLTQGLAMATAQNIKLPAEGKKILKSEFRSYQQASDKTNLIKGDWNGDG